MDFKRLGKKANLSVKNPDTIINTLIIILLAFSFLAAMIGPVLDAGDTVQTSGIPLGTLFGRAGVLFIALAGGIILLFVKLFRGKGR